MSQSGQNNSINGPLPSTVPIIWNLDIGSATAVAQVMNLNANATAGSTVFFNGSSNNITLTVTDFKGDTIIGRQSGNPGASILGGNTGLGAAVLSDLTTGSLNTGVSSCLGSLTTGNQCTAIGYNALDGITTGGYSTAIGVGAGQFNTGSDSSNIYLMNGGVSGDSNVMRLGTQGFGNGNINKTFIAGINGVTVSNADYVTINTSTGQLGVASIPTAIQTIDGDTGSATGSTISLIAGYVAGNDGTLKFAAGGSSITLDIQDANNNICLGALSGNFGGALGSSVYNVGIGYESLNAGYNGTYNTALGYRTGYLMDGSYNTLIGYNAGSAYTSSEADNICIGAAGTAAESNVMRLGTSGSGNGQVNKAFIAGVTGVTVANPEVVMVNSSTGQFGVAASNTVGAWVYLDSESASTSSTVALSGISSKYNNYVIVYTNVTLSGSISFAIQLNNGSGFQSSGYTSGDNSVAYNSATFANTNATYGLMFTHGTSTSYLSGNLFLCNLNSGAGYPQSYGTFTKVTASTAVMGICGGSYNSTFTTTSIQVIPSSGTITTGTFTLYGILE